MTFSDQLQAAEQAMLDSAAHDNAVLSQSRCVDILLDLFNAATSESIREVVTTHLGDIRHLRMVPGADMVDALGEIREVALFVEALDAEPVG